MGGGVTIPRSFETERLRFRYPELEDINVIHRQFSDPEMCRYLGEPPMDRRAALATIEMFQNPDDDAYLRYVMVHRTSGEFIGACGYHHLDRSRDQVELGYDIWREHWRQGYMSETLPPLLRICFEALEIDQVYVLVDRRNEGSIAIASQAGFGRSEPCRPLDEPSQVCMKLTRTAWERSVSGS